MKTLIIRRTGKSPVEIYWQSSQPTPTALGGVTLIWPISRRDWPEIIKAIADELERNKDEYLCGLLVEALQSFQ